MIHALGDLVRRAQARETITDTTDFSQTLEADEGKLNEEKIEARTRALSTSYQWETLTFLLKLSNFQEIRHHSLVQLGRVGESQILTHLASDAPHQFDGSE